MGNQSNQAGWQEVENLLGVRVDRRGTYRVHDGVPQRLHVDHTSCSGCSVAPEEWGYDPERGGGCHECGYHGRRVERDWVPLDAEGKFDWDAFFHVDELDLAS